MKTIEETVNYILDEVNKKNGADKKVIEYHFEDRELPNPVRHVGETLNDKREFLTSFIVVRGIENLKIKKVEVHNDVIEVYFGKPWPRFKRIYQCGSLYVSELTQSGTFEFDTNINAAFNFIDWSYDDLLYHEFFRNSTGKFLLVEDDVIRGELQLFSSEKWHSQK